MDFKKIGRLFMLASGMTLLASCTLDEPKDIDGGDSGNGLVKEITMMGLVKAVSVQYDNQNRVTKISSPTFDFELQISYNGSKITSMTADGDDGRIDFTDVQLNDKGYIASFVTIEANDPEHITQTFQYDNDGHLVKINYSDGGHMTYTWSNGLLTAIDEYDPVDPNHTEHFRYTYTDIKNEHYQWSPFWYGTFNFFNLTGLFGKAPSKFIATASDEYSLERYDYKLTNHGYIRAERAMIEGETITLNYRY